MAVPSPNPNHDLYLHCSCLLLGPTCWLTTTGPSTVTSITILFPWQFPHLTLTTRVNPVYCIWRCSCRSTGSTCNPNHYLYVLLLFYFRPDTLTDYIRAIDERVKGKRLQAAHLCPEIPEVAVSLFSDEQVILLYTTPYPHPPPVLFTVFALFGVVIFILCRVAYFCPDIPEVAVSSFSDERVTPPV